MFRPSCCALYSGYDYLCSSFPRSKSIFAATLGIMNLILSGLDICRVIDENSFRPLYPIYYRLNQNSNKFFSTKYTYTYEKQENFNLLFFNLCLEISTIKRRPKWTRWKLKEYVLRIHTRQGWRGRIRLVGWQMADGGRLLARLEIRSDRKRKSHRAWKKQRGKFWWQKIHERSYVALNVVKRRAGDRYRRELRGENIGETESATGTREPTNENSSWNSASLWYSSYESSHR